VTGLHLGVRRVPYAGGPAAVYFGMQPHAPDWRDRIVCDAGIHHGEPVIRGTRIAVSTIVASMTELSIDDLLREFSQLSREDVEAALLYAAEASRNTLVA
jgi:uncharacterized protein (DUF433 family)